VLVLGRVGRSVQSTANRAGCAPSKEAHEVAMVSDANAVINERAVVVKTKHAMATVTAVVRLWGTPELAATAPRERLSTNLGFHYGGLSLH
jgi:hypothetical protein